MTQAKKTHRVQVNLPDYLYQLIRERAYKKGTSISDVIRGAVESSTANIGKASEKDWQSFMKYVGSVKGHADDSLSHDTWAPQSATFHEK
jgi:metal-responsive CopG/Arc/MetJ family transcriptional regulator